MKAYAGIGSRNVPEHVLDNIFRLSVFLSNNGYTLRSGAADGCDTAFEVGCDSVDCAEKEIYLPWRYFKKRTSCRGIIVVDVLKNYKTAQGLAAKYHPAWRNLSIGGKKLHTRNVYQIRGMDLNSPVDFVVCYTSNGGDIGGTGQAIRIAESMGIPIFNLFFDDTYDNVRTLINEKQ